MKGELRLDPSATAVVTSELQRGVVGPQAVFPALAAEAQAILPQVVRVVEAARRAGAPVIHGVVHRRADGRGANHNARLFVAAARAGVALTPGSHAAGLIDELGDTSGDLISSRLHGLSPMAGTGLDPLLRNLGVQVVIVVGVSVNIAVTNLVMDAVNAGYTVVLPRDAVAGTPGHYAHAVIDHTLALLATVTTADSVCAALAPGP